MVICFTIAIVLLGLYDLAKGIEGKDSSTVGRSVVLIIAGLVIGICLAYKPSVVKDDETINYEVYEPMAVNDNGQTDTVLVLSRMIR